MIVLRPFRTLSSRASTASAGVRTIDAADRGRSVIHARAIVVCRREPHDQIRPDIHDWHSGQLSGLDLSIVIPNSSATGDVLISILPTTGPGLPDPTLFPLTEVTVPASYWAVQGTPNFTNEAYRHIDLHPIPVNVGDVLAISVTAVSGGFSWQGGGDGRVLDPTSRTTYTPGNPFSLAAGGWTEMSGFDFAFQTYIARTP